MFPPQLRNTANPPLPTEAKVTYPKYHVAKDGQTLGPYTEETINLKLNEGHLNRADYVLDPKKQEWVTLNTATFLFNPKQALPPLTQRQTAASSPTTAASHGTIFVNRDRKSLGQFTEQEISHGLNNMHLLPTDLAWRKGQGLTEWIPLGQLFPKMTSRSAIVTPPPLPDTSISNYAAKLIKSFQSPDDKTAPVRQSPSVFSGSTQSKWVSGWQSTGRIFKVLAQLCSVTLIAGVIILRLWYQFKPKGSNQLIPATALSIFENKPMPLTMESIIAFSKRSAIKQQLYMESYTKTAMGQDITAAKESLPKLDQYVMAKAVFIDPIKDMGFDFNLTIRNIALNYERLKSSNDGTIFVSLADISIENIDKLLIDKLIDETTASALRSLLKYRKSDGEAAYMLNQDTQVWTEAAASKGL
jgi:hypothetical protein